MVIRSRSPVQAIDPQRGVPDSIEIRAARFVLAVLGMAAMMAMPAEAHSGTGLPGGFGAGLWHPISGLDHLLAMVSVGLWGTFLGRPMIYVLPMVFPGMMVVGAAVGMSGIPLPPTEVGIAVSVITLGTMILFAVRAPAAIACAVVGLFALFHGYAHGAELPSAADPIGYSAGFVLCTGMLHLVGIALGTLRSARGGTLALRSAGGVIVMIGGWFLYSAVAA